MSLARLRAGNSEFIKLEGSYGIIYVRASAINAVGHISSNPTKSNIYLGEKEPLAVNHSPEEILEMIKDSK